VARALGYKKPENAVAMHVDRDDTLKQGVIDSLGREQFTTFINESGLYSLILSSKLLNKNTLQKKLWKDT
jgi:prophage antirepressor-like protein